MIKDFQVGQHINERLVLTQATRRNTKGTPPRPFAALTFSDGRDTISGNLWNYTNETLPEVKKVYRVSADIGEYNGTKQLNAIDLRLSSDQDMSEFSMTFGTKYQVDTAWDTMVGFIKGIQSKALRAFLDELIIDRETEWRQASSAISMHHAGMGGNIVHTAEVVCFADAMVHTATDACDYDVAWDLTIAGALLHDVGKLQTYHVDGPACQMTYDGVIADHVALGARMLWQTCAARTYPDVARLLEHIILSHHGKLEYGCPVVPKLIEAEIVCRADGLSAQMAVYKEAEQKAIDEHREGVLTDRVYVVGNSQLPRRELVKTVLEQYWEKEPF